jgi:hypothetical protein
MSAAALVHCGETWNPDPRSECSQQHPAVEQCSYKLLLAADDGWSYGLPVLLVAWVHMEEAEGNQ